MQTQERMAASTDEQEFTEKIYASNPISAVGFGFVGTDEVVVQVSHDNGTTFNDLYQNGSKVVLRSTNNMVIIDGPGIFKFYKAATTGAVGVSLIYS